MARVELLFGATAKEGPISDAAWSEFLAREVTPRFPDGLTAYSAFGQWRKPDGEIARIPTRVLVIWYAPDSASEGRIEAVREAYKAQFDQLSVMRVDSADCVSF